MSRVLLALVFLLVSSSSAWAGVQYYVSELGNDSAVGTSPSTAWQTLARVNAGPLGPGDTVAFHAGQVFLGTLRITRSGTEVAPITVTSYNRVNGSRAVILAGAGTGIHILNAEYVRLSGLQVVGAGPTSTQNSSAGVLIENTLPYEYQLSSVHVDDLDISGFYFTGLEVKAAYMVNEAAELSRRHGYRDLRFTNLDIHDNGWAGLVVGGCGNYPSFPDVYCHHDVTIIGNRIHDNHGVVLPYHTGDGLYVWDVDGAIIEQNSAYRNGKNNQTSAGPVGIWAYWSKNLLIQFNESYENRTSNGDGGGFDLDGGVSHSVMQFNTSHHNDGSGFLVYQFADPFRPNHSNVIRNNVSAYDARRDRSLGAFQVGSEGVMRNILVSDNTIYIAPGGVDVFAWGNMSDIRIRDNQVIFAEENPPPPTGPTVTLSPTRVAPGSVLTVTWSGIVNPTSGDWIGLYAVGAAPSSYSAWAWATGTAAGSIPLTIPASLPPGRYEARYLVNKGYESVAVSTPVDVAP